MKHRDIEDGKQGTQSIRDVLRCNFLWTEDGWIKRWSRTKGCPYRHVHTFSCSERPGFGSDGSIADLFLSTFPFLRLGKVCKVCKSMCFSTLAPHGDHFKGMEDLLQKPQMLQH